MIALLCVVKERKYICYVFILIHNSDIKAGVHKSKCARSGCRLTSVSWRQIFGFLSMELVSCHSYGACRVEVVAGFFWGGRGGGFVHRYFKVQKLIRNKEFAHLISYAKRTLTELAAGRLREILIFCPCRCNITCTSLKL